MVLNLRTLFVLVVLLLAPLSVLASPAALDVRLVVDISGSMKQNDPQNLRRPAVRMISELLDDGSVAGIWTFGEYVNMLVPHGIVDSEWREYAVSQSQKINSVALRTHIGAALEVASEDFYRDQRRDNTHFILLTDGMVDVAPGSSETALAQNQAERDRILKDVVPRLAEKGAQLHAIALSANTDQSLLKQLARATNGSYTLAQTDQSLSRAFLNALNRSRPTEEVPLQGNHFPIDDSVSEFTAIIFHGPDEAALGLRAPSGVEYLKPDASLKSNGRAGQADENPAVRWVSGSDYALVTVEAPMGGEWEILGSLEEGSRVKIVSDLGMKVTNLPGYFFADQPMPLSIAFEEAGKAITDPDILRFLTVKVTLLTEDGRTGTKELSTPGEIPEDGIYRDLISRLTQPGEYTFTVTADGKTFQRQSRQTVVLRPPMDVDIKGEGTGERSFFAIHANISQPDMVPESAQVLARVTGPDGGAQRIPLTRDRSATPGAGGWLYTLSANEREGEYTVEVELQGKTAAGRDIAYSTSPITLRLPRTDPSAGYQTIDTPAPATDDNDSAMSSGSEPQGISAGSLGGGEGGVPAEAVDSTAPAESQLDQNELEKTPDLGEEREQDNNADWAFSPFWLWAAIGTGLTMSAGLGGWLVYRRQSASRQTDVGTPSIAAAASETDQPEPAAPPKDAPEEAVADVDENSVTEHEPGADARVTEVMSELEADTGADASPEDIAVQDPALVENEDEVEFSLEDFDLSDVDDLTAEEDGVADLADGERGENASQEPPPRQ